MTKHYFIAFILFANLFLGCKKDGAIIVHNPPPTIIVKEAEYCNLSDSCSYLPRCTSQIGLYIESLYPRFSQQKFNPNNSDEIAFFKSYEGYNNCVVIYNLVSKVSNTITTAVNMYGAELDWAKDGNVYYNGDNQQVQQYNPNTKTITQLKLKASDVCPRVNDSVIFTTGGIGQTYYKNSLAGVRLDSIYGPGHYAMDFSTNNLLAYSDTGLYGYNVALASYPNKIKKIERLTNFNDNLPSDDYITDIKWHPNNEDVFFVKRTGTLYKVNIKTRKVTLIKTACNWRPFTSIAIRPDGKKILMCYDNYRVKNNDPIDYCNLQLFNYFSIMDLNGCNEEIIYKEVK